MNPVIHAEEKNAPSIKSTSILDAVQSENPLNKMELVIVV